MRLIVFAAAGLMFLAFFTVWLQTKIQYRIGSKHLKISCLGLVLRRIDLADIKRIHKRPPTGFSEKWYSTTRPKHRILTIQRSSGIRKYIVITPRNRYVFMNDLLNAIKRVKPDAALEVEAAPEPADAAQPEPT